MSSANMACDSDVSSPKSPMLDPEPSNVGVKVIEYSTSPKKNDPALDRWGKVLQRVIKAIVTIKVTVLCTFDTHQAESFEDTGFVVDRAKGIILSNRHIVTQAPITATATFGNCEVINIKQEYFNPVHDFGFFRYDPAKVKFANVEEIELHPQGAKVGLDIKVCGND